jgi:hypothetical protein
LRLRRIVLSDYDCAAFRDGAVTRTSLWQGRPQQQESKLSNATGVAATPHNQAAIDFLKLVYPQGPWVLTAIALNRKELDTKTFRPATEGACLRWLQQYNGERNIYWSVNRPLRDLTKKTERADIKEVVYLHVDIDPRAGEDLQKERARCAALFADKLPDGIPAPTAVVFSGGGYQAFWKLETPIPINGEEALYEEAKRYNQQLEQQFDGDNCHNIDRIMRLPGTVNVPDERKRKKGRKPELAMLVSWTPDNVYPLQSFTPAAIEETAAESPVRVSKIKVTIGDYPLTADLSELDRWNVPDRVKVIIVQGKHPDEPKEGDNSRSVWVFDAVCNLIRCGVPDNVIYGIINDPAWGISESIREKGGKAHQADRGWLRRSR